MRYRFLHAADLHLDTPFTGLEHDHPELAARLRDASLDALDRLVDVAIAREVAFVLLAGDVYDGAERGLRAQLRLLEALRRLDAAGIDALIVHGNHDPVGEGYSAIDRWPERTTVFDDGEVQSVGVERDGTRLATVHGVSYATRAERGNLARRFARTGDGGLQVGLLHATVGEVAEHAPYAPCTLADLRAARLDYWALGHIHQRQVLAEGARRGEPWVVYPGNTQGRSFKPSERGAKGAVLVEVDLDHPAPVRGVELVPLDGVRFEEVAVDAGEATRLPEIVDALRAGAEERAASADGRPLLLRARVAGRAPAHGELARPGADAELLAALRDAAGAPHWDQVRIETAPPVDRDAVRARGDVTGELVALVDRARAQPDLAEELLAGARALERSLRPAPETTDDGALLAEAEALAIEALDAPRGGGG